MVYYIEFPVDGVDDNQVERLVIIKRIAMQPVAFHMIPTDVEVDPSRCIGNNSIGRFC